jgi:hypothetical protein
MHVQLPIPATLEKVLRNEENNKSISEKTI